MPEESHPRETASELLAIWRAAGRDTVAARAAAAVAKMALAAATAAQEAADEVEVAAEAATEAAERARGAAAKAKSAAAQAAEAAQLALQTAQGDKVRANHDVEIADGAEAEAREAFHDAEAEGFGKA